jgi:hypothetical protein
MDDAAPLIGTLVAGAVELQLTIHNASSTTRQRLLADWAPFSEPATHPTHRVACDLTESSLLALPEADGRIAHAPEATRLSNGTWLANWQYYRAEFAPASCSGTFAARVPGFEHLIRAAVAWSTLFDRGILFHGATLVYGDQAILFAGHPGAGKSTISREGQADRVICNEISILQRRTDGWYALASPFWGTGDQPHWRSEARLAGITHGVEHTAWQRLDGVHAIAALAPHVGIQARAQSAMPEFLTSLRTLTTEVPTHTCAWYRPEHPLQGGPFEVLRR